MKKAPLCATSETTWILVQSNEGRSWLTIPQSELGMKSVRLGVGEPIYSTRGGGGSAKMRNGDEKESRAGPGTGSMGGKCSVCGDRATKVSYCKLT